MRIYILFITILFGFTLNSQTSKNVELLSHWNDNSIPPNVFHVYNDVWGFEFKGMEYACVGSTMGTHIFEVPPSHHMKEIAFVPGRFQGAVTHRDFAFFQGYIYAVCDQGFSSLQVIDLNTLPDSVSVVFDDDYHVSTAHNVTVDEYGEKLYVSGLNSHVPGEGSVAMKVFDLSSTPASPEFLSSLTEVEYVHDVYVRKDTAYLSCGNPGLYIYDYSDPLFPQVKGAITEYPESGYNHSGWLNGDGDYYAFADETPSRKLKILDVSDFTDLEVACLFNSELNLPSSAYDPQTMAHNVEWVGDKIYVSHYFDGLQVFDASDPENIKGLGYYDTHPVEPLGGRGAWGVKVLPSNRILISDRENGLFLVRLRDENSEDLFTIYPNPNNGEFCLNISKQNFEEGRLRVYDSRGGLVNDKLVLKSKNQSQVFSFKEILSPGVYYVHLSLDGDTVEKRKIIVD